MKYLLLLTSIVLFSHCSSNPEPTETEKQLPAKELTEVQQIEKAHKKEKFLSFDNIKFDIELIFGGKQRLKGTMTTATNSSQGKIEMENGNAIYFIQDKVYFTPGMNENKVRFDAYTWSYFFLFPYKLSDPGTIWSQTEKVAMNGKNYDYQMLTFENGTGDAPDDWYKVFSTLDAKLIEVSAYIVTANKSAEEAEKDPHAIVYSNYQEIDGIPLASTWGFYGWTETDGLTDTLGTATLSNFEFVENTDSLYVPPANFLSN